MPLPAPRPGLVIGYSYLWRHQQQAGELDGRKDRPCAIVVTVTDDNGETLVYVAPITHRPPTDDPHAVELPKAVKRRLGLDAARSWIVTSELNRFIWPGWDLRPVARDKQDVFAWGLLPVEIFEAVKQGMIRHRQAGGIAVVDRA